MDVEKTMQFILEQQAKHEVWLQEMREAFRHNDGMIRKLVEAQTRQLEILTSHQAQIDQLTKGTEELRKSQLRTDEAIKSLVEQGRHTDERLNALIKVVDDLIRRNGSSRRKSR